MKTPWGDSETVSRIHPDIILVTTPSHGGIHIFGETAEKIPQEVWNSFSHSNGWAEEDCEAVIALAILGMGIPGLSAASVKRHALNITRHIDSRYAHCAQHIEAPEKETPVLPQIVITFENKGSFGSSGVLDSIIVFVDDKMDASEQVTEALREYVSANTFAPGDVVTIGPLARVTERTTPSPQ